MISSFNCRNRMLVKNNIVILLFCYVYYYLLLYYSTKKGKSLALVKNSFRLSFRVSKVKLINRIVHFWKIQRAFRQKNIVIIIHYSELCNFPQNQLRQNFSHLCYTHINPWQKLHSKLLQWYQIQQKSPNQQFRYLQHYLSILCRALTVLTTQIQQTRIHHIHFTHQIQKNFTKQHFKHFFSLQTGVIFFPKFVIHFKTFRKIFFEAPKCFIT
eukprot:TRINITY_DN7529_c0_g1_i2.p2 TRINITY_DN7529_c0_g1~~TRINITY_DN7529_c0_g1_i2.p2  ORF type:complete len:213 (-),score=-20.63 TRINITY_DN7529_c0_g1_i2:387-1025(-)